MALKLTISDSKKRNLLIFLLFYFLPFSFYYFPLIKLPWSVNLPVLFITIVFCSLLAFFDYSRFFTFFDLQRFFKEISYYLLLSCVVCCFILVCVLFIMFFYVYFLSGRQSRPNRHLAAPIIVSFLFRYFLRNNNFFVLNFI